MKEVIKLEELAELQIDAKIMITRASINRDAKADAKGRPGINRAGGQSATFFKMGVWSPLLAI